MNCFQDAIERAQIHAVGWEFAEIESVTVTRKFMRGAFWYPPYNGKPARVEIGWRETSGIIWHESFHSALHNCPLKGIDRAWSEGLCNAFAACNDGIARDRIAISPGLLARAKTEQWVREYCIPEEKILREVGRVSDGGDAFFHWFRETMELARVRPEGFLNEMLRYDPTTGQEI